MSEKLVLAPHDEEIEQSVLGALLLGGSFDNVIELISAEDLYFRKHQAIFSAMNELSKRSEVIDYLTVSRELETNSTLESIGGKVYLAEMLNNVVSTVNLVSHAKAVKELSMLRGLMRIGQELVISTENKQPSDKIATEAEHRLFTTMWARQVRPWRMCDDVMGEAIDHLEMMQARGSELSGISTGLTDLDKMLGGWQKSDLVIVAARPSMGKSSFMCTAAMAAARNKHSVAISSLEMSSRQLAARMIAIEAHVDLFALNNGRLERSAAYNARKAAMAVGSLPIRYDDSGLITMDQLRAKTRQLKVKGNLDVLFVDYLQLMGGNKSRRDSRQVEVSEISRGLKLLAKELDITVVAMSQLSRACEAREDRRPLMSDIRESGAIEQDADIIIALYRDEVYVPDSPDKGVAELLVRKHRNGPIGDVRAAFIDKSAHFADLVMM